MKGKCFTCGWEFELDAGYDKTTCPNCHADNYNSLAIQRINEVV